MAKKKKHRETLLEKLRAGLSIAASCSRSGISRQTYYDWIKQDKDWAIKVEAARDQGEEENLKQLKKLGRESKDWRAFAWLLEHSYPDRYSTKREIEITQSSDQTTGQSLVLAMLEQTNERLLELQQEQDNEDNDQD